MENYHQGDEEAPLEWGVESNNRDVLDSFEPVPLYDSGGSCEDNLIAAAGGGSLFDDNPASASGMSSAEQQLHNHSGGGGKKRHAAGDNLSDDIPVISRRKKKRKGLPKRALSAYNLFFQRERQNLMDAREFESGKISFEELGKIIGKRWKDLSPDDRKEFEALAAKDSIRYRNEMEAFNDEKKKRIAEIDDADPPTRTQPQPISEPRPHINMGMHGSSDPPFSQLRSIPPPMYSTPWPGGSGVREHQHQNHHPQAYHHHDHHYDHHYPLSYPHVASPRLAHLSSSSNGSEPAQPHQPMSCRTSNLHYYPPPNHSTAGSGHPHPHRSSTQTIPPLAPLQQQPPPKPVSSTRMEPQQQHGSSDLFPIPPGMELMLPDRDGRDRKYIVEYVCYSMTREAAQEYMDRLSVSLAHHRQAPPPPLSHNNGANVRAVNRQSSPVSQEHDSAAASRSRPMGWGNHD